MEKRGVIEEGITPIDKSGNFNTKKAAVDLEDSLIKRLSDKVEEVATKDKIQSNS